MSETAASTEHRPLDDMMLAMDVVDTLRHSEKLVAQELDGEARDQRLLERLREIYAAQGLDVPDRVLKEGVDALREQRFVYAPPAPSFQRSLARLYVSRETWGKPALICLAGALVLWVGYYAFVDRPREARIAQEAIEIAEILPKDLEKWRGLVVEAAAVEEAKSRAEAIFAKGMAAAKSEDAVAARAARDELQALHDQLMLTYELRVVSRQGEQSGVWRVPDANPNARNYYLIVEAIGAKGKALSLPVTNEENGQTKVVDMWGLRVGEAIFDAVRDDKADDGIIQNNRLGIKRAGYLEPEYAVSLPGGKIFEW